MQRYQAKKCNHNPFSNRTSMQAIIKRPLKFLSDEERIAEEKKPDARCAVCGLEVNIWR